MRNYLNSWRTRRRDAQAAKAARAQTAANLAFARSYISAHGLDFDRDTTMLKDVSKRVVDKYLVELRLLMDEKEKDYVISSKIYEEDNTRLVANIVNCLSSVYTDILMVYFGNLENLVAYIGYLITDAEYGVILANKSTLKKIKNS